MKLWMDDVRPTPPGYIWINNVYNVKQYIWNLFTIINIINIDHDAGDYAKDSGDYIKLLDWLEETNRNYPIYIHSMNSVGIHNMIKVIQRNG